MRLKIFPIYISSSLLYPQTDLTHNEKYNDELSHIRQKAWLHKFIYYTKIAKIRK